VTTKAVRMKAVVEAAWEAWSPCGDDARWCTEHHSYPPCEIAVLGQALMALDYHQAHAYGIPDKIVRTRGAEPS